MKNRTIVGLLVICCAWGATANAAQSATTTCDRECLRGKVTQLLYGLVKHDVSGLPVAGTLRVTEDAVEKPLAKVGLVGTVTRLRGFRQDIIDQSALVRVMAPIAVPATGTHYVYETMKAAGMQVNDVDKNAFIAASKTIYEEFGKEVQGAKDLIDRAVALVQDQVLVIPLHRQMIPWLSRAGITVVHRPNNQVYVPWVKVP